MRKWRLPLRIARREALRAKGRTILMLVMIALPVMGVTAADVLIQTQDVNTAESIDRRIGTEAAARVSYSGDRVHPVEQARDPEVGYGDAYGGKGFAPPTLAKVLEVLGGGHRGLEMVDGAVEVQSDRGVLYAAATEVDLRDPLAQGLYDRKRGRLPEAAGEAVVNEALAGRGPGLGESITVELPTPEGSTKSVSLTVVGIVESTTHRTWEHVFTLPGALGQSPDQERSWLVSGGPVRWDDVLRLNAVGAMVLSRAEILDPSPAALEADKLFSYDSGVDDATITIAILVVVMALIEVVLLAGPAFAVGARRQARPLALLAATGGTPAQARRVVLATGVVIGTVGSVLGVALGIGIAFGIQPIVQSRSAMWFGPFEVPWLHLIGVAGFGFVSALIAAVVPAWIASRQDVVAVLAGRRGDRKPSARSPFVGLALLGLGVGSAWGGSQSASTTSAILIGVSAILSVLGMLFVVPVLVVSVARFGRWMPLALRFAVRDAARHRTRTTPAIAAVAATVAGVVALGIGVTSDEEMQRDHYRPTLAMGTASVSADTGDAPAPWNDYVALIERGAPGVASHRVVGVPYTYNGQVSQMTSFSRQGERADGGSLLSGYVGSFGAEVLVYDGELPALATQLEGFPADAATRTLKAGGVVVFVDRAENLPKVEMHIDRYDNDTGESTSVKSRTVPSLAVPVENQNAPTSAIVPASLARELGLRSAVVGLLLDGRTITKGEQKDITEGLHGLPVRGSLYVERGYQTNSDTLIIQLVLGGLGAILMLGGTLTATFLALSDARPDLATLSAVGATPRMRRGVAAGYALAVGGVGALLGVLVGFVPGIAATYPLTSQNWAGCYGEGCPAVVGAAHYLNVPWTLIGGLVVVLPLFVAGVVWLFARSRLPLVSRLS